MPETLLFILTLLARGLALLLLALGVASFLRSRSASTQHHLWRGVFTGLAMLPLLSMMPSLWHMPYKTDTTPALLPPVSIEWIAEVEELEPLHLTGSEALVAKTAPWQPRRSFKRTSFKGSPTV